MVIKQIGAACWLTPVMAQGGIDLYQLSHDILNQT